LGIITGLKENSALVVDPGGKAYVVKSGMEIGKNGGQIHKISNTSIEVIEQYRDENGKIRKRTVKLTLPRKE
jgi:type IV pilus assembly protein PilP